MSRPPADLRISLKQRGGPTFRIELIRVPFTRRFRVRRNGTRSRKLPEATATEIANEIRRWLARHAVEPEAAEQLLPHHGVERHQQADVVLALGRCH